MKRALVDGTDVADAHLALGMIRFIFDWDWEASDQEYISATALDPANALAFSWHGIYLAAVGRQREALAAATKARDLDPLSPYTNSIVGLVHFLGRQYRQGLDVSQKVLDQDPNFMVALWTCAYCCAALSRHDEAVAHLQKAVNLTDRLPIFVGMLGQVYARAGERADAEALLRELGERFESEYVPPVTLSWIAMALGDVDRAFDWLEQECRDRGVWLFTAKGGAWFDDFRSDPRFQDLLRRMNFPDQPPPGL